MSAVAGWYVVSLADGETHLAVPAPPGQLIVAQCDGRQFRPLAALRGAPPDPAQICLICQPNQSE